MNEGAPLLGFSPWAFPAKKPVENLAPDSPPERCTEGWATDLPSVEGQTRAPADHA
jgi:hypothetical protein